jgi:DNA-binding PadR family transcriptional regulator
MTAPATRDLAPGEWAVLGLLGEGSTHGFALARALAPGGEIGEIWAVPRPLVYRALGALRDRGLVRPLATEAGQGPNRTIMTATPAGLAELDRWLGEPVAHVRDVRSLLLLKLAYTERSGRDARALLERQRELIRPLALAQRARCGGSAIELWRCECMDAVVAFTENMLAATAH